MKKKIIIFTITIGFLLGLFNSSYVYAQTDPCASVCRVPGNPCNICRLNNPAPPPPGGNSTGGGAGNNSTGGGGSTTAGSSANVFCSPTEINTAIGCIPALASDNGVSLMSFILRWAIGIGSGIAFLLILYGGFTVMTSSGSPDRLKAGNELLTSAISGLVLLIFSVFILNFIGVNILGIF